jgi:hypothetical protein
MVPIDLVHLPRGPNTSPKGGQLELADASACVSGTK